MELKSLFLGIFFSMGIFAIKNGVGLHYFLAKKMTQKAKIFLFFLYSLGYLFIFFIAFYILRTINIVQYFDIAQKVLKSGMFIHILMAGLLFLWGIILLKRQKSDRRETYAWLYMVVPCPVCITVILFSVGFLIAYFPNHDHKAILCAYFGFIVINLLTLFVMKCWRSKSNHTPKSILGSAMLMISIYFFLSVIIMPRFGDLDKIYRLASYQGELQATNMIQLLLFLCIIPCLILMGFFSMRRKLKGVQN
jgi:predicted transporter